MKTNTHFLPANNLHEALFFEKLKAYQTLQKLARASLNDFALNEFFIQALIKNKKLVYSFCSNSAFMEFSAKKEAIKQALRTEYKKDVKLYLQSLGLIFTEIKAVMVLKSKPLKQEPKKQTFVEKSSGNFKISVKNELLKKRFLELAKTIEENTKKGDVR